MAEPFQYPYQYRLKQFQKAICSTMDWKTSVIKLHDRVIQFARQASVQENPLRKLTYETKALRILNYLTATIIGAKKGPGADPEMCDYLAMIYLTCSVHLAEGNDQEAIQLISKLLRQKADPNLTHSTSN